MKSKTILDVCCGGRMWWRDKADARAVYMDKRELETTLCDGRVFRVSPDPNGDIRALNKDFVGWVAQIPEDDDPNTALDRINSGAHDFNLTPRGRRLPLKTVAEACEFGSAKIFKEHKLWIKTKEPILAILSNSKMIKKDKE